MRQKRLKCELYNDSMQNWKKYPIQKAQLIIADVPYNVGTNFYGFEINRQFYNRAVNEMILKGGGETNERDDLEA